MLLTFCVITLALSSFLLFLIQPLIAKILLPVFGGVPEVWNVCMVFFQGTLLLGYIYAYMSSRFLKLSGQVALHFCLIIGGILMLSVLWMQTQPLLGAHMEFAMLMLLAKKLILPIFIISATAPLVQFWFGNTSHPQAKNPYFLYSASNVGSLFALLSFPILLEPFIGLQHLTFDWKLLYFLFSLLLALTVLLCCRAQSLSLKVTEELSTPVNGMQRMRWLLLSFAPSSLLLAVTQNITTDIAAIPMLWILPLFIYLLTFVIAFARKPIIPHQWMVRELPMFLIFPLIALSKTTLALSAWELIAFHLLGFFALTMVCNGELVASKPQKSHLTEFYLWLAFGGFLGGIFNGIVAPLIFNGIYEYYIAFCVCVLLCPWPQVNNRYTWQWADILIPASVAIVLTINHFFYGAYSQYNLFKQLDVIVGLSVIAGILMWGQRPFCFAASVAVLFFFALDIPGFKHSDLIWQSRNFFGVTRVYKNDALDMHVLMGGRTLHGVEFFKKNAQFNNEATYYKPVYSVSQLLTQKKSPLRIAVAGLGAGVLSCEFRKTDEVTFFEIDPMVIKIAQHPPLFSYLQNCPPAGGIVQGDARLNLAKVGAHYFDVIVIDVFSSDAIPVHLFTREAVQTYMEKLSADGLLMFNISSSHLNIQPVLTVIGQQLGLAAFFYKSIPTGEMELPSEWMILTNNNNLSQQLLQNLHWQKLIVADKAFVWTDDFSNILRVLR